MSDAIIKTEQLTKEYGRGATLTKALRGIDLEIPRGSFTCIVGPSGHGKSTLMHLIGGLDRPSGGSVFIDGKEMASLSEKALAALRAEKIGFVFQFFNLLQNLTARENIETALMLAGVPEAQQRQRTGELLALVSLAEKADAKPGQLSGGQQQRVAIARALAADPAVMLADEPTANLDSKTGTELIDLMRELNRERGATFVISSHDPKVIKRADRVIQLEDGRIVSDDERSADDAA